MSRYVIEDLFVDVPGGKVYVKQWIPENARHRAPVILLHDSLGSTDLWRDFPEKLAFHLSRPVAAYDRLGFGKSSAREGTPSYGFMEEEAELFFPHVKKALGLGPFVLFGHSAGGGMSVAIASRDQDCVAVVTQAAQAFIEEMTVAGIRKTEAEFEKPGQIKRLERWHGDKAMWVLRAWIDRWAAEDFSSWSLEPYIDRVSCPVLAVHGAHDFYGSTAYAVYIAEHIGKASELAILDDCGHNPHRDNPEAVMERVRVFLETHRVG